MESWIDGMIYRSEIGQEKRKRGGDGERGWGVEKEMKEWKKG